MGRGEWTTSPVTTSVEGREGGREGGGRERGGRERGEREREGR